MTDTPPRKRAPRKAAPAADTAPTGVTAARAQQTREQLEAATGEEVTTAAARKLRGGVTAYKVSPPRAERLAHAGLEVVADHPDDPGPAEPVDLDDAGPDRGEAADVEAAQQTDGDPGDDPRVERMHATFAAELERLRAARLAADEELPAPAGDEGGHPAGAVHTTETAPEGGSGAASPDAIGGPSDPFADDDVEVDLRDLIAGAVEVELDPRLLVAGRVETTRDGSRVTVLDRPRTVVMPLGDAAQLVAAALDEQQVAGVDLGEGPGDPTIARLSLELAAAVDEARALEARAGELKEAAEAIRSQVREALGGEAGIAETAIAPDGTVLARWTRVTSKRLDQARLKRERPDVVADYMTVSSSRRFTWAE